jgi:hypothetical protein
MNEKYDLKAMLKEIEEDEKLDLKPKTEKMSQNAISNILKKKKKKGDKR